MEFDVSKVYTAANADELPIGSKCYFADDLRKLKDMVLKNDDSDTVILKPFDLWALAYLVELPKEEAVKPFKTIEEARAVITEHGGFIKNKDDSVYFVTAYTDSYDMGPSVCIMNSWSSLENLAKTFVFADDNSPCGGYQIKKF